jgi:phosphoenolpyruvate-protein kinase (PTS system EI component)
MRNGANSHADITGELRKEVPQAEMAKYYGVGSSLPGTVIGKAAFVSAYSAYDMLRHIELQDIKHEQTVLLPKLIEDIKAEIANENIKTQDVLLAMLDRYKARVERYFKKHQQAGLTADRLIRNRIGALEFFLSIDLRKARDRKDIAQEALLKTLLGESQKQAFADINQTTVVTKQDAIYQWGKFVVVRDGLIKEYSNYINTCQRKKRELGEKIEALNLRNARLALKLAQAEEGLDSEEAQAIRRAMDDSKTLITQCKAAQSDLTGEEGVFRANIGIIEDMSNKHIKGPENMQKQQKTLLQILYTDLYRASEMFALDIDLSREGADKSYKVFVEIMKRVESVVVRLTGAVPLYLKTSEEQADLVLLSNQEILVEALIGLLRSKDRTIKAIVCLEGSIASHWVAVAQSRGIPVVLLGSSAISAEEIASLGDDVIVEIAVEQDQGTIIFRPDAQTRNRYGLSSLRQQFYYDLCLQQYALRRADQGHVRIKIYANIADEQDAASARDMGIEGIGLYRTELSPSATTRKALIEYAQAPSMHKRQRLLNAFIEDLYNSLTAYKERTGPFIIRTDDFEEDKNTANIVEALDAKGFDLYKTAVGKEIVTLRIAGYYIALAQIQKEGGYAFEPGMIFPMVKEERDMHFMREEVIPQARNIAVEHIGAVDDSALPHIKRGPMIETVEACDNLDHIIVDKETSVLSVGNSDLTASVLSRNLGIDINRGDRHFRLFFSTLKPSMCGKYFAITEAVSVWNAGNAQNPKALGFCGAQATTEEFILFACFLQREFDNVPIYISVPSNFVPLADFFVAHITEKDLDIFAHGIGFKAQQLAHNKAREIHARIKETNLYKQQIEIRLKDIQSLGIESIGQEPKALQAFRASLLDYKQNIKEAIDSAA